MKLTSIMASKAVRLFPVLTATGGNLYGPSLARAFEDRYGFLQGPRTVADYEAGNGIIFQHGRVPGGPVIDKFTIFNDGVVADTKGDTAAADAFIDDVIQWASNDQAFHFEGAATARRAYLSHLVAQLDSDLAAAVSGFESLGQAITATLHNYGQEAPTFNVSRLALHGDLTTLPGRQGPPSFSIERRENEPYGSNLYFCVAPLTTRDHLMMLSNLEAVLNQL